MMKSVKSSSYGLPILSGCQLDIISGIPSHLIGLKQSLVYQSELLGLKLSESSRSTEFSGFELSFKTSGSSVRQSPQKDVSAVKTLITPWQNDCQRVADEQSIQAACGMMSVHGRAQGQAQLLSLPYISTLTACMALQGMFATKLAQLRGLELSRCDVSMMTTGLMALGQYIAGATAADEAEKILPSEYLATSHTPFVSADYIVFELETLSPGPWKAFWQSIGVSHSVAGKGWTAFLMRYAKAVSPLPSEMKAAILRLPYSEIQRFCEEAGVAICPVRSLSSRQGDTDMMTLQQQGPWQFSERRSEALLHAMHLTTNDLPLSGMVVVEACRRIQGPLAGHLLASLGAKVIRVEPPGGDPLRGMLPTQNGVSVRFDALNRLKETIEIDIKTSAGQSEIKALIQTADVFLHNWAPGKAEAFSLDSRDMRQCNSQLIYAYAGGWGLQDDQIPLPGTDFMAQAYSGLAESIGQYSEKPGGSLFTVLDILGGVVSSQGIVAALLARQLSGSVTRVDTSLLATASLLTANKQSIGQATTSKQAILTMENISSSTDLFADMNATHSTKSGLLVLGRLSESNLKQLLQVLAIPETIDLSIIVSSMKNKLLQKTAREWVNDFSTTSIAVAEVMTDLSLLTQQPESQACLSSQSGSYASVKCPWNMMR